MDNISRTQQTNKERGYENVNSSLRNLRDHICHYLFGSLHYACQQCRRIWHTETDEKKEGIKMGIMMAIFAPIMAIIYPFVSLGTLVHGFVQSFINLFNNLS